MHIQLIINGFVYPSAKMDYLDRPFSSESKDTNMQPLPQHDGTP